MSKIEIVFDGPPSHEAGRFVEVEQDGKSINFGEWREREDGYWVLEFDDPASLKSVVDIAVKVAHAAEERAPINHALLTRKLCVAVTAFEARHDASKEAVL